MQQGESVLARYICSMRGRISYELLIRCRRLQRTVVYEMCAERSPHSYAITPDVVRPVGIPPRYDDDEQFCCQL